ncbi:rod shape-determining protein MreC [Fischerella thermalis]|jgi:rod shape-determining protein MreC|uniref:Cell shape-determining protein MreC n=1 Tax=Fischerella thermalis JSC-11 TaxID=741277 RepID=G6FVZ0_9CYAN|nr:rod shape-determining protein MreC [Fischerella thermalis]PMB02910.1 rod shape-determining protein MreC [Fischerella thermalis CCMEE 5328]PMB09159.1 rod shape-determining protein MreC [Fischerella thermalis CCMEE 5273]EHC11629.1 Rod shape-determining protein MreC [Fischerella thermalis JSC-11]PLZ10292.1 rod shape-determining protein MreC [Fischerella thermalis WC114]PLZ12258.1 rod shape-determining protein MreC [Fischerella thermalis WC119]
MFTARRWWEHKGLHIGILSLIVGGAWILRQTQGALLLEIYQGVTSQFQILQPGTNPEERLKDARVLELEAQITELENQNKKLQQLLGYVEKEPISLRPIPARVVGRSADNWWQQVILNRGSLAGIQEGFVVKAEGGLVGLVESVTPNTSRVLLISDLKSKVGVNISRTGAKGVVRGDASAEAVLEFYEKVPNVKPGDVVVTSTYSQKFPSGWPIGRIKSLDLKKLPASVAKVELFPSIRSLDWVTVYPKPENQQQENP